VIYVYSNHFLDACLLFHFQSFPLEDQMRLEAAAVRWKFALFVNSYRSWFLFRAPVAMS
jgi:hypothetical protein